MVTVLHSKTMFCFVDRPFIGVAEFFLGPANNDKQKQPNTIKNQT